MEESMKKVLGFNKVQELSSNTKALLIGSIAFLASSSMTGSIFIGLALAILAAIGVIQYLKQRTKQRQELLSQVWPEVIDHLISGLHSGLSISEALSGLAYRGPEIIREEILDFNQMLREGHEFGEALNFLREKFAHPGSDQIFEALALSKTLGGGELINTLRTLGAFQRDDLILKKEISIKHGWVKNSAHISAAAPWILLLIIGTQSGTSEAFATPSGVIILGAGVFLTLIAYLWMSKLSKLPETPRVFKS